MDSNPEQIAAVETRIIFAEPSPNGKPTKLLRVLTIRIPPALHTMLSNEATARNVSINTLAKMKLGVSAEVIERVIEALSSNDVNAP